MLTRYKDITPERGTIVKLEGEESEDYHVYACLPICRPICRQGFIFGMENQQISPKIIRKVGVENIWVIAMNEKPWSDTLDHDLVAPQS